MKSFEAKLGKMRKAQQFVTYPRKSPDDPVVIQSEKSIGKFNPTTGWGVLSTSGAYFIHLTQAVPFQFPPEVVKAALDAGAVTADGSVVLT